MDQIQQLQAENTELRKQVAILTEQLSRSRNDVNWENNTLTEIARIVGLPATQPIRGLTDWIKARWAK